MKNGVGIEQAKQKALIYIAAQQKKDGGFVSSSSSVQQPFLPELEYQTTFVPSLILSALSSVTDKKASTIRRKIEAFLLQQKSEHWSYNYWAKQSVEYKKLPYPDDLDDTFCALSALAASNPQLVTADMLAAAVKLLIATEAQPGGPYRTWLVPADSKAVWLDIDVAVNSNIAYFLVLASEPLPSLAKYIDQAIQERKLRSPYYPSAVPLLYFISRGYSGNQQTALLKIIKRLLKSCQTDMERALLISSSLRLNLSVDATDAVETLVQNQKPDGSWPAAAFCIDPSCDGKTFYHGAAALTTAFVVEALALYAQESAQTQPISKDGEVLKRQVLRMAQADRRQLGPTLRPIVKKFLLQVTDGSSGQEILGLPWIFNSSLKKPLKDQEQFLTKLSLANLYGWAAYTIYDDFLDGEGNPGLLSVANVTQRQSYDIFSATGDVAFKHFVAKTFNTIDSANAWELAHCRFVVQQGKITVAALPHFGKLQKLAERSVGHLLGPMAILQQQGHETQAGESQLMYQALSHYLIARQLNDDAHDWEEDMRQGSITYVVATILHVLDVKPGVHDIEKLVVKMRKVFWHSVMVDICKTMQGELRASRRALVGTQLLKTDSLLAKVLDILEASIKETLQTQDQAVQFLKQYTRS